MEEIESKIGKIKLKGESVSFACQIYCFFVSVVFTNVR